MISIKNFVDVNLKVEPDVLDQNGFKTVLYFTDCTINHPDVEGGNFKTVKSLAEFEGNITSSEIVRESVKSFFINGGVKLCVVSPTGYEIDDFKSDLRKVAEKVGDYYFVVIGNNVAFEVNGYSKQEIANIVNFGSDIGWDDLDKKSLSKFRVCLTTDDLGFVEDNSLEDKYAVVKYSTFKLSGELLDAALLVGAYFSRVDIDFVGAFKDYNFTPELLGSNEYEDVSQEEYDILKAGKYNFIGKVAGSVVNLGGDYTNGVSLVLDYGASSIERALDFATISMLLGKLPLDQGGQAKLIAEIKTQLNRFVSNGLLNPGVEYLGETLKVVYNGVSYDIVETGDILPLGYKVFYVPINAIDHVDRVAKRFPYIYVVLQTVHGARLIKVNGGIE